MEIAIAMQSRAKKKRMKEQQKEDQTIHCAVEILSSLLSEMNTNRLSTPIDKLNQLVVDTGEQMKSFEDATYLNVENKFKKKRNQLMNDIDKDKVALTVNKDHIKDAIETRGKILSTITKFSLFCDDLMKRKQEVEKELEVLSESFIPLNDSTITYGRLVVELQHKLKYYENEQVKRTKSLQELQTLLIPKVEILQRGYKEIVAILATPEMSTIDYMEKLACQIRTHVEITNTLLETWHNDLKQLQSHFGDAFSKMAL